MLTSEEKSQINDAIIKSPKSIWGYWVFILPVILVVIGVITHAILYYYFSSKVEIEVLVRSGNKIETLWDSDFVRRIVLTTSGCIILSFVWITISASHALRQNRLLKKVVEETKALEKLPDKENN